MPTFLITQATGRQSQWTIKHLLEAGAKVHALVRDPRKIPDSLTNSNITIFDRDNDNPEAIFKAAQGCQAVFLNTYPDWVDVNSEGQQAKLVLEACKKAGVHAVVASTSFCTGNPKSWSDPASKALVGQYYQSKANIEEVVRAASFNSYTILRPAVISYDYTLPSAPYNFPELPKTGTLTHAFEEGVGILQIDENDIGKYAAAALLDPVKFGGQEIELANECLTMDEVRDIMARASGKNIAVRKWTAEELEAAKAAAAAVRFQLWANIHPQTSTAKATEEAFGIPFTSLEKYFEREKAALLECLPSEL